MGYIDENLMNGEQVVHRSKLHWIVFLMPIALIIIAFMYFAVGKETAPVGGFIFLIAIIWAVAAFISFKTSEFGVTNKRVLIKVGFIRRNSLILWRITNMNLRKQSANIEYYLRHGRKE